MRFKDLKKSLTEKIEKCYILTSNGDNEDLFLKASCFNNVLNATVKDFVDLNLTIFSSENLNEEVLKKSLNTMPFMSEKRLVVIKETENKKNDAVIKLLEEYLKNPSQETVLLIDTCEKSNFKALEKNENVLVVDCSRLERDIVVNFILKVCKNKEISIDQNAINKLIDFCDGYINKVDLEINKLINYKLQEKVITSKDVEELVNKSEEYQIFSLTNALIEKNGDVALFIVDDIIKNKKNISMILSLIYNHIRRLFYAKITNATNLEIAKMLDIKEFAVKKLKEQSSRMSAKLLKETLILCEKTDYNIKSGNADLISAIYNLVFTILVS